MEESNGFDNPLLACRISEKKANKDNWHKDVYLDNNNLVQQKTQTWYKNSAKLQKVTVIEIWKGNWRQHELQYIEILQSIHSPQALNIVEDQTIPALKLRDLRCIIQHDRVMFMAGRTATSTVLPYESINDSSVDIFEFPHPADDYEPGNTRNRVLHEKISHLSTTKLNGPFELVVLETILMEICWQLVDAVIPLKKKTEQLLAFIRQEPSSTKRLHEVTDIRRNLDTITDRVSGVHLALKEVLDSEEQLRRINITRLKDDASGLEHQSICAEDAELLLQCYEQELESLLRTIKRTDTALDDGLQMVQLHLANVRNVFLKSELGLDIVGVVIGFVAAIGGLFGMNIKTGIEESEPLFWALTVSLLLLCVLTAVTTFYVFRKTKL